MHVVSLLLGAGEHIRFSDDELTLEVGCQPGPLARTPHRFLAPEEGDKLHLGDHPSGL